jgi:hypothetical protein
MNIEHLVTQYRQANSDYRLALYMQYRQFRSFFEEIEQEEWEAKITTREIKHKPALTRSSLARIMRWCYSLFS